jgi:hypothetical protein
MIRVAVIALLSACSVCAHAKLLYTGTSAPSSQGWTGPFVAAQTLDPAGFVTLDTTSSPQLQDGYARIEPLLSSTPGFQLDFTARLESETHDKNDRAGFSLIVTDQNKHGIELGFWGNEIWAQQLGFTHGASALFTTTQMTDYRLTMVGDSYALSAGGNTLLSGNTIFYDAPGLFGGNFPYRTPNVLFFGDDTTSASARFSLKSVSITAVPEPSAAFMLALLLGAIAMLGHARGR